jgi:hypothetical protein
VSWLIAFVFVTGVCLWAVGMFRAVLERDRKRARNQAHKMDRLERAEWELKHGTNK